jgi:uncharacterized membrane protein YphA (DoxX/SURF4 family)
MTAARSRDSGLNESAPFIVRLAQGSLMAGHGAQKLFGSFGGPGLEGTSGFMEMLGMRPGRPWAYLAGLSEFGGGVLTALGLLNPLGPTWDHRVHGDGHEKGPLGQTDLGDRGRGRTAAP